jgi:hypothetical protein
VWHQLLQLIQHRHRQMSHRLIRQQRLLVHHHLNQRQQLLPQQLQQQHQQRHRLLRLLKLGQQHLLELQEDQMELAVQNHHRLHQ